MNILQARNQKNQNNRTDQTEQTRIIEQVKFTYSSLDKAFEKQTKTIKKQEKNKQMPLKPKANDQRL